MASLPCWCCQHAEFEKQFGIKIPHPFPSPQGEGVAQFPAESLFQDSA
jgi:hypothetical protein